MLDRIDLEKRASLKEPRPRVGLSVEGGENLCLVAGTCRSEDARDDLRRNGSLLTPRQERVDELAKSRLREARYQIREWGQRIAPPFTRTHHRVAQRRGGRGEQITTCRRRFRLVYETPDMTEYPSTDRGRIKVQ